MNRVARGWRYVVGAGGLAAVVSGVLLALGVLGAAAAPFTPQVGAGASKQCVSPTKIDKKVFYNYGFTNLDGFGKAQRKHFSDASDVAFYPRPARRPL